MENSPERVDSQKSEAPQTSVDYRSLRPIERKKDPVMPERKMRDPELLAKASRIKMMAGKNDPRTTWEIYDDLEKNTKETIH